MTDRIQVGGTALDHVRTHDVLDLVRNRLQDASARPLVVASSNLDHVHHFGRNGQHVDPAANPTDADWIVTPDGMPVVLRARRLTGATWEQVAGSDMLPEVLAEAERCGVRVGFLGGWSHQHEVLDKELSRRFRQLVVAGYWAPEAHIMQSPTLASELALQIAESNVDLLVVSLGKPAQELWLACYVRASGARVALAFGAAADFLAGTAQRAPVGIRRLGLEWAYRLAREPRRLWRRYLVQGPRALVQLLRQSTLTL